MDCNALVKAALDYGADKAELIAPAKLVCSNSFRAYCEDNLCGFYGKCWSCPPDVGEIEVLTAQLRNYEHIVIYQVISPVEDISNQEEIYTAGERLSAPKQQEYGIRH